jgi:hypothetical protein
MGHNKYNDAIIKEYVVLSKFKFNHDDDCKLWKSKKKIEKIFDLKKHIPIDDYEKIYEIKMLKRFNLRLRANAIIHFHTITYYKNNKKTIKKQK